MFVILTSKPGQYRSEPGAGMQPRERYDYLLCGRLRARFVVAELQGASRVRIVDEADASSVNEVPSKFLPTFERIEQARSELENLVRFGDLDARLVREEVPAAPVAPAAPAKVRITFLNNNERQVSAPANSSLLRISLREQGGIPFKCGGGVCGTCKCRIVLGRENTDAVKPKERKHLDEAQLAQGYRLACQTFVHGDIAVAW
ncbi:MULTISPECIES: 2Fe-2S iron-sulfur cluster-binding protein [Ramlibacter]|uniref:2Fe-2S iron-sulfur cluster-binding protein n=1 Tax=Ramlibacter TaxID=174951 RepID=UPI00351B2989